MKKVPAPALRKLSPQRQVTLPNAMVAWMGETSHITVEAVNKDQLLLTPALATTMAQVDHYMTKRGVTSEIMAEAMRIVRERKEGAEEGGE